ncbi:pescadillo [Nematocida displodere]|uniref:Pescadillo n=1 Tax=Nematocida displodere TaxID=1805483 RepID=A0A177EIU2_9MICR|nr:pescadillo [Nematocida displodere]
MSRWYTNIIVKRTHVTRDEALVCLGVETNVLDRLCVLNDVHPFIPHKYMLTNKSTRIQYKISDIHRIRESEAYKKMNLKATNKQKTATYQATGRHHQISDLPDDRIDYGKILLEKYPSFDDIYEDLGECLTCLIVAERTLRYAKRFCLDFETDIIKKIRKELTLFYLYVAATGVEQKVFITPLGVYFSIVIGEHDVFWRESYPLKDEEDILGINYNAIVYNTEYYAYLLEKVNFRLFKAAHEPALPFVREYRAQAFPSPNLNPEKTPETCLGPNPNDCGGFGEQRMKEVFTEAEVYIRQKHGGIFKNTKFFISESCAALTNSLELLILTERGTVVKDGAGCDIYLCETIPANFRIEGNYAHPQIVYDSCNARELQETPIYRPGQTLPQHSCPFKDALEETELDIFNLSERKKQEIGSLFNHHK